MAGESWLSKRLTPSKQTNKMWLGLADAVQAIFDQQIKPLVERIGAINSYFTMDPEDLQKRIDELGGFFYFSSNIEQEDMPLALMQKLDEVHFKRTDLPIQNAMAREFNGLQVTWAPLYAPKVITPEGSVDYTKKIVDDVLVNALRTETDIADTKDDINNYWMTSRGVIQVNSSQLADFGFSTEEFSAMVARIILPLMPTDIVYDGEQIVIHYDVQEAVEKLLYLSDQLTDTFEAVTEGPDAATTASSVTDSVTLNNALEDVNNIRRLDCINLDFWIFDKTDQ